MEGETADNAVASKYDTEAQSSREAYKVQNPREAGKTAVYIVVSQAVLVMCLVCTTMCNIACKLIPYQFTLVLLSMWGNFFYLAGNTNPFVKQAYGWLASIPAAPAHALEFPAKEIALGLHPAAQTSDAAHITTV